ncbi:hypothetical protein [Acidianus sulfidivorans]|uniref:hypothetical protein n=1 Tax=Acidianus sulfidivorans TaxID=312539 RepID=UPI00197CB251|nr:hypothetical protein [Acidianus sulfidivorans]
MVSYTYCVEEDNGKAYLVASNQCKGLYYIFSYTNDKQLIISKCKDNDCTPLEDITEIQRLRFKDEPIDLQKILYLMDNFKQFLNKYNIKIYFLLDDTSILDAIYSPTLYYYKYLGVNDHSFREEKIAYLKEWGERLSLLAKLIESLGVKKFTSHLDSLDGRYALWIGSEDPVTSFISYNNEEVTVWILHNNCDIFLKSKTYEICVKSGKIIINNHEFSIDKIDRLLRGEDIV